MTVFNHFPSEGQHGVACCLPGFLLEVIPVTSLLNSIWDGGYHLPSRPEGNQSVELTIMHSLIAPSCFLNKVSHLSKVKCDRWLVTIFVLMPSNTEKFLKTSYPFLLSQMALGLSHRESFWTHLESVFMESMDEKMTLGPFSSAWIWHSAGPSTMHSTD